MAETADITPLGADRRDFIRLRTLTLLRWMAIGGQLMALVVSVRLLGLQLPLGACFLALGASIIVNIGAGLVYPRTRLLNEFEAMGLLTFDVLQLGFLLFLTGGLSNPFAMLLLAPVTVAATALTLRATLFLGLTSSLQVLVMLAASNPLAMADGSLLELPVLLRDGHALALLTATAFLGIYSRRVAGEMRAMSQALLAVQMALAREQKLTDLGGVVAAAAHELGTPLATIKLVSSEMLEAVKGQPDLEDDARLIRDQADRCRDILRSMGRAGKEDLHLQQAPLGAVLDTAAEPHKSRGKRVEIAVFPEDGADARQPLIRRRPELIHGLRNLVQNAVDFARSTVWIDGTWNANGIVVRVIDDGAGYPPQMLGRIGDPFVTTRPRSPEAARPENARPEYEGMGLGLFIAKTLLERTGAELTFANGSDPYLDSADRPERCGAVVVVTWPLAALQADPGEATGENPLIKA